MKQVININFQGRVVPIEVSAFDTLKEYTDSLRTYFSNEEGRDEIINDIESRIAELFQERLKTGATCITDGDMEAIINSMGRPADFAEAEGTATGDSGNSYQQPPQPEPAPTGHKRLYRDENNKVLGGVCAGLANYFNIDPVVVRIIFVVLLFAGGIGFLPYIIFWVAVPSTATKVIGGSRKKFFRDPDDKIIAGVCSGIGNYFGINAWIPRVLFLLPFISVAFRWGHWGFYDFPSFLNFSISPGSLIVYIILWLAVPEATTTAEKLEMKGEKVDMNSIKNSVMEEMKGVGQRMGKAGMEMGAAAAEKGKEIGAAAAERGREMGADLGRAAKRSGTSLGDIIAFIAKGFAYFIVAVVGLSLVFALFAMAIAAIGIFPLKDYMLQDGWQQVFAWGTLLFFIAVPIIGIITWIVRRIAKIKGKSKLVRWSFASLWLLGWVCAINLIALIGRDFRSASADIPSPPEVYLSNPAVNKLELTTNMPYERHYRNRFFRLEPFGSLTDGDTLYLRNVTVFIEKSTSDSFRVTMAKYANGPNRTKANETADRIVYDIRQKDSILLLPKGLPISTTEKFRNQQVLLVVYVPVGKKIKINRNVGWGNDVRFSGPFNDGDWEFNWDDDHRGRNWDFNTEYTMTDRGLRTNNGTYINEKSKRERYTRTYTYEDDNYRYRTTTEGSIDKADSLRIKQQAENKRFTDSLNEVMKKTDAEQERRRQLMEKAEQRSENETPEEETPLASTPLGQAMMTPF
jgi:phage shock protein PspC (stress-responsive transcriptional regulator)